MKPRRTHFSNAVFMLEDGNEDNDLWLMRDRTTRGTPILRSTWVPNKEERKEIAEGHNIELVVFGEKHPPVAMMTCNYPLGKRPEGD